MGVSAYVDKTPSAYGTTITRVAQGNEFCPGADGSHFFFRGDPHSRKAKAWEAAKKKQKQNHLSCAVLGREKRPRTMTSVPCRCIPFVTPLCLWKLVIYVLLHVCDTVECCFWCARVMHIHTEMKRKGLGFGEKLFFPCNLGVFLFSKTAQPPCEDGGDDDGK